LTRDARIKERWTESIEVEKGWTQEGIIVHCIQVLGGVSMHLKGPLDNIHSKSPWGRQGHGCCLGQVVGLDGCGYQQLGDQHYYLRDVLHSYVPVPVLVLHHH
jgi:hypothetical protein